MILTKNRMEKSRYQKIFTIFAITNKASAIMLAKSAPLTYGANNWQTDGYCQ